MSNDVRSQDAEQCEESDERHLLSPTFVETTTSVILMTREQESIASDLQRADARQSATVTVRSAGNANISDMRLYSTMRTAMGCYVLLGEHTFSEEQEEMHVECISGINGRPRHGGNRWHESDLERLASSWTTVAVWRRRSEQYSPRRRSRSTKQRVTLPEKEEWLRESP